MTRPITPAGATIPPGLAEHHCRLRRHHHPAHRRRPAPQYRRGLVVPRAFPHYGPCGPHGRRGHCVLCVVMQEVQAAASPLPAFVSRAVTEAVANDGHGGRFQLQRSLSLPTAVAPRCSSRPRTLVATCGPARARAARFTHCRKGVPSGRSDLPLHECTGYPTAHPNWTRATFSLNIAEFIENNVTPVHVHVHVHVQVVTHHLTDRLTLYIALVRKIPVKKSCVGLLGIRRRRSSATRGNATWRSIARALAASTDSTTRVASAADTLMLIQLVPATGVARGH